MIDVEFLQECFSAISFFLFLLSVSGRVSVEYVAAEGILFLVLLCHYFSQPFQKKWHNKLDIFLLLNLFAVNTLTIIRYYSLQWEPSVLNNFLVILQLLFITLPLIYICGYVGWYILINIKVASLQFQDAAFSYIAITTKMKNILFLLVCWMRICSLCLTTQLMNTNIHCKSTSFFNIMHFVFL